MKKITHKLSTFFAPPSFKKDRTCLQAGFTLVELLVVIAIVGILAVGIITVINPAKQLAKARDNSRKVAVKEMSSAIQRYMINSGNVPPINRNPCCGYASNQSNFLQELIDSKEMRAVPTEPGGGVYYYYDYGANNSIGAIVITILEGIDATTVAPEGSCRPFGNNWCSSTVPSKYYCICNPY